MMADLLLTHVFGKPRFTWGRLGLADTGKSRGEYRSALREADGRNYAPLLAFVRS